MPKMLHLLILSTLICSTVQGMDEKTQPNVPNGYQKIPCPEFIWSYNRVVNHELFPQLNSVDKYVMRNIELASCANFLGWIFTITAGACFTKAPILMPVIPIMYGVTSTLYKHHFKNMHKEWDKEIAKEVGIDVAIEYFKKEIKIEEESEGRHPSSLRKRIATTFRIDNTHPERLKNLEEYKSRIDCIQRTKQESLGLFYKSIPLPSSSE